MEKIEVCTKVKEAIRSLPVDFLRVSPWNDQTLKVEVSSSAFEGLKRLERFEKLDALLKETVPEIFSTYKFIYKPFTQAEWDVKNAKA